MKPLCLSLLVLSLAISSFAQESQPQMEAVPTNEEQPSFRSDDGYTYDVTGKRDPFHPYDFGGEVDNAPKEPVVKGPTDEEIRSNPLLAYDVKQFQVIGIMWEVKEPKALLRDPSGKVHMLRKNVRIGRNKGFVSEIREGEVVVTEPFNESGLSTAITQIIALPK